jgi:DNA helicase-2/ATP-dependent DNA helicase PcrA
MGERGNLCVVGDDDQSIYGWRGADQRNILDFEKHFPNCTSIFLTANYRCKAPILDAANTLIAKNRHRKAKTLTAARGEGSPVRLQVFSDNELESEVVVRDIARLARQGVALNQVAILMRRSAQAPLFEQELGRRELNYRLIGGKRTADKKAARDLFAYLQVVASDRNEIAFRRAISTPSRGIGATTIERMRAQSETTRQGIAQVAPETIDNMRAPAREALSAFQESIQAARSALERGTDPKTVFTTLLDANQYQERLSEEINNEKVLLRHRDDLDRTLDLLQKSWSDPTLGKSPRAKLNGFVNRLTLASAQDEANEGKGRVTLSTIHGVKGLEFDHVWVVGIEEGSLPNQRCLDSGDLREIEEERRLLYVAITRARDHLILTRSNEAVRGERRAHRLPSRFLIDLEGAGVLEEDIAELPKRDAVEVKQDQSALMERLAQLGVQLPGANDA